MLLCISRQNKIKCIQKNPLHSPVASSVCVCVWGGEVVGGERLIVGSCGQFFSVFFVGGKGGGGSWVVKLLY